MLYKFIEVLLGMRRDAKLAVLLFSLNLNDLPHYIRAGLAIDNILVPCLMYADDIVLLSEDSKTVQLMIN